MRLLPKQKRQSRLREAQPAPTGPNGQRAMCFVSGSLDNGRRMTVLTIIGLGDRPNPLGLHEVTTVRSRNRRGGGVESPEGIDGTPGVEVKSVG